MVIVLFNRSGESTYIRYPNIALDTAKDIAEVKFGDPSVVGMDICTDNGLIMSKAVPSKIGYLWIDTKIDDLSRLKDHVELQRNR